MIDKRVTPAANVYALAVGDEYVDTFGILQRVSARETDADGNVLIFGTISQSTEPEPMPEEPAE